MISDHHYTIPETCRGLQLIKFVFCINNLLYHSRNLQGTTTASDSLYSQLSLYHSRNLQGTTTLRKKSLKKLRLYHSRNLQGTTTPQHIRFFLTLLIIPFQKPAGDYNYIADSFPAKLNYTIPETCRGLQQLILLKFPIHHYTIPETCRGLQR